MTSMIDKIRAEIDRLAERQRGWYILKSDLLSFLDTLQEQEPQGLEKKGAENRAINKLKVGSPFIDLSNKDTKKESFPQGLDEAAYNRVTENGRFELSEFEEMRIKDIKFGAEWMAEKMKGK